MVVVTAGKPTELAFTLSKSSFLPWTAATRGHALMFRVTNDGARPHAFEVCTTPTTTGTRANACHGKETRSLAPGEETTLSVEFGERGVYEYLSTARGDAAGGMKGLIGVGVRLAAPATAAAQTAPVTTTAPASSLVGNANDGKPVFLSAGCGTCHRLAAAGAAGDSASSLDTARPTQPVIVQFVTNGATAADGTMPAYAQSLTPTQIDDLAAYVYLTTHTIN